MIKRIILVAVLIVGLVVSVISGDSGLFSFIPDDLVPIVIISLMFIIGRLLLRLLAGFKRKIEITDLNNHIDTPLYSITVPPGLGWYQNMDESDSDQLFFEKTVASDVYVMSISTNDVADESMVSWSAKQVADEYRNGEQKDMVMMGVNTGQYELTDIVMGEEKVGDKQFYTMTYTTKGAGIEQRASLYLYFPLELGSTRFIVALYSEAGPANHKERKSLKNDFIETLDSLKTKTLGTKQD